MGRTLGDLSRKELFIVAFLLLHFSAAVFVDLQSLYPRWLVPGLLKRVQEHYLEMTADPLVASLDANWKGRFNEYTWFWSFTVFLEALLQVPLTLAGAIGIWKKYPATPLVLLVYGTITSVSLIPCLATIWYAPPKGMLLSDPTLVSLTEFQRRSIIGSYIPFLIIPSYIAFEASRVIYAALNAHAKVAVVQVVKARTPHEAAVVAIQAAEVQAIQVAKEE